MTEFSLCIIQSTRLSARQIEQLGAIYLDSFPPYARVDLSFLLQSIAAGNRWLFLATHNQDVLGFAILVPSIARGVHLLEYLAVARAARGLGIGGKLIEHIVATARDARTARGILLEVEHDEEGDMDERAVRQRRIAFYLRHGARVVEAAPHYRVPLAERAGTLRMRLLWLPIVTDAATPRGDALRESVMGILAKSYGLDEHNVLWQEVLASILQ